MASIVFQKIINQLKDVADRAIGVTDQDGRVISCTDASMLGVQWPAVVPVVNDSTEPMVHWEGKTFRGIAGSGGYEYFTFCDGEDREAETVCAMAHIALSEAKSFYEEKHDRGTFIKNIIMDNILPGDIYIRAKELRFDMDAYRVVFLVRQTAGTDVSLVERVSAMFPDKQQDFVLSVNETDVAVVKHFAGEPGAKDMEKIASGMESGLKTQPETAYMIGISTAAPHLRDLADAYKEAQIAIEVGRVFDTDKRIISYENLGIGRLIYQLPTTLCEIFLTEVFKKNSIDALDKETLFTINKFFENNLNVSETARKLYVHRNTLVYRLEKINKLTGLDLRRFDHAIVFRVALMVRQYLSSRDAK